MCMEGFEMKKIFLVIFFCLGIIINQQNISANVIKNYDIVMDVKENGIIHVKQKLNVIFYNKSRGIDITIPRLYDKTSKNGPKKYHFSIKNFKADGFAYEIIDKEDRMVIKTGSDNYFALGIWDYRYEYDIVMRDVKSNQNFNFNLVSDKWEIPIEQVGFTINMPKKFVEKPKFLLSYNLDNEIKYTIENNTIKGTCEGDFSYLDSLVIEIPLGTDYFDYPIYIDEQPNSVVYAALMLAIIAVLFLIFGKELRVTKSVQFKPPHGMSSAQVGYIVDGVINKKDIVSLFVYWSAKGYMKINEIADGSFEFVKKTDISEKEIGIERVLFNSLFSEGDSVSSNKMPEEFLLDIKNITGEYEAYFKSIKAPVFETKSRFVQMLTFLAVTLFLSINMTMNTLLVSKTLLSGLIAFSVTFLLTVFLGVIIMSILRNRETKEKEHNGWMIVLSIIYLIVYGSIYVSMAKLFEFEATSQLIIIGLCVISFAFVAFMDRRTIQGNRWLGEIWGLKDFIEKTRKKKIELFVEKSPEYFYEVLPYAYVLNVSDKWISKFEEIPVIQPVWYKSPTPLINLIFIANIYHSLPDFITEPIKNIKD